MADPSNRTLVCSIVFLDIVEYSKKPVGEQLALKQQFNRIVGHALAEVEPRDRIVLDTGDGAAITFLGDPEDALFAAMAMRDAMAAQAGLPVRMGINLGPARLIKDINNQPNIIGDGINVAQRVMSFAETGQLLVSRSFYEVVSCLSADYAKLFGYVGARTDKHVREHEVYSVGKGRRAPRPVAAKPAGTVTRQIGSLNRALTAPGPLGLMRATYLAAPLIFVLIVAAALQLKYKRDMLAEPAPLAAVKPPALPVQRPAAGAPRPAAGPAASPAAKPAPAVAARSGAPVQGAASGRLEFLLIPSGEVIVDGKSLGMSPPLQTLDLPPGEHVVQFRFSTFRPHTERVQLRAGESRRLVHRFK
jgi:class 3 adenylate cyclase